MVMFNGRREMSYEFDSVETSTLPQISNGKISRVIVEV
jgi:hypothetical protein